MLESVNTILTNFGLTDYILSFFIGFGGFFWLVSILWVLKDISARSYSTFIHVVSIVLIVVFTPVFGLPIYFLIRPITYKYDNNGWRDAILMNTIQCKDCGNLNSLDFDFCVFCGTKLKIECKECKTKFSHEWDYCSKCGGPNLGDIQQSK